MFEIYITSACRTAIGTLGKSLKNISVDELGSAVISGAIDKSKLKPSDPEEIIMGQVLTSNNGQNPARQAAIKSSIPRNTCLHCESSLRLWVEVCHICFSEH